MIQLNVEFILEELFYRFVKTFDLKIKSDTHINFRIDRTVYNIVQ